MIKFQKMLHVNNIQCQAKLCSNEPKLLLAMAYTPNDIVIFMHTFLIYFA